MDVQTGRVMTEGDELYYEVRGQGEPLLMIAGGGGDSQWYNAVAEMLADEYKVITYDRRANARSTINEPQNFEITQQSRDAVAVLHAAGETSAFVFGNSSGAVIALDMAKTQPQAIRAVVVHEPPLARVHPNSKKWMRFFAGVYSMAFRYGTSVALIRFILGVGLPVREFSKAAKEAEQQSQIRNEQRISRQQTSDVLAKLELLPITGYLPDIDVISKNGVKVFMAAGEISLKQKKMYAETVPVLAQKLGCQMVTLPSHHMGFVNAPKEWSEALRRVLQQAVI